MNGYLLDTHIILWAASQPRKLSTRCRFALERQKTEKFISVVSVWELVIKVRLGKLELPLSCESFINTLQADLGASILSLDLKHLGQLEKMPLTHRDPFDRALAAQALSEKLTLLSKDASFDAYGVERLW